MIRDRDRVRLELRYEKDYCSQVKGCRVEAAASEKCAELHSWFQLGILENEAK